MEIILIRHGDPDYKNDTLTKEGHREAEMLAKSLSAVTLDAIYVSPYGRTKDTLRYTARMKKMDYVTQDWLREVDAPYVDGCAPWDLSGKHILGQSRLPDVENWREGALFEKAFFPYYKNIAEGFDRVISSHGYEKVGHMYRIRHRSNERIAFFAHKGLILTLLSYLLHWPLPIVFTHCEISPTGVTHLMWREIDDEWAVPKLLVLNDLSHLKR